MVEVEEVGPAADEAMTDVEEAAPVVKEETTEVEERAPAAAEAMAETETAVKIEEAAAMAETAPQEEIMPEEANVTTAGPTAEQAQLLATLGYQGMPPELNNEVWLNSEPLKLADLHGKVVIVEFWTFACYNCKNVVPSLREWHQKYAGDGLVIIGVHTPEFGFEREIENVKQALVDQDIPYAVAIDNDWKTWRAYNNHYWPAKYFVDKAGNLRHIHIGEGRYQQQEEIIQALLAENASFRQRVEGEQRAAAAAADHHLGAQGEELVKREVGEPTHAAEGAATDHQVQTATNSPLIHLAPAGERLAASASTARIAGVGAAVLHTGLLPQRGGGEHQGACQRRDQSRDLVRVHAGSSCRREQWGASAPTAAVCPSS
jgi:thiol-disulfide isomerase/thioredoxin